MTLQPGIKWLKKSYNQLRKNNMKINQQNYFEIIENANSGDTINYKNIRFQITKTTNGSNFKLKSNYFIFFLTLIFIVMLNSVLGILLTQNNNTGSYFILGGLVLIYFIRKISLYFTEKIYSKQIFEFYQILKLYKQRQINEKEVI